MPGLAPIDYLHFLHRAARYRLRTERQELAYIRSLDLTGRTAVDVGAHRGIYSWWLRRAVGPSGRVVSFEPQPDLRAELERMIASFRYRNIEVVPSALSDRPGTATLARVGEHSGGASLESHADAEGLTTFEVPLTTLDAHFFDGPGAGGSPVAFIKCDVEGHERAVFRGGQRLLTEHRPRVLFECHDRHAEEGAVFDDLDRLGYKGWLLDGRERHPVETYAARRASIDKPYLNYIFEPAD